MNTLPNKTENNHQSNEHLIQKLQLQVYLLLEAKSRLTYKCHILEEEVAFLKSCLQQSIQKHLVDWCLPFERRTNSLLQEFEFLKNDERQFMDSNVPNNQLPYGYGAVEKPLRDEIQSLQSQLKKLQEQYDDFLEKEHQPLKNTYVELLGDYELSQKQVQDLSFKYDSVVKECDKLRKSFKRLSYGSTHRESISDVEVLDSDEESDDPKQSPIDEESKKRRSDENGPERIDFDEQIITPKEVRKRIPSIHAKKSPLLVPSLSLNSISPNSSKKLPMLEKKLSSGQLLARNTAGKLFVEYPFSLKAQTSSNSGILKVSIVVTDKFYEEPVDCLVVSNTQDLDCSSDVNALYAKELNKLCKSSESSLLAQCQEYLRETDRKCNSKHKLDNGSIFCGQFDNKYYVINVFVSSERLKGITLQEDNANRLRINQDPIYKYLNTAIKNVLECADNLSCTSLAFCPILSSQNIGQYSIDEADWIIGYRSMFLTISEYHAENKISTNIMDIRMCVPTFEQAMTMKKVLDEDFITYISLDKFLSKKKFPDDISKKEIEKKKEVEIEPKDPMEYYSVPYKTINYTEEEDSKDNIEFMDAETNENTDSNSMELMEIKCATLDKLIERVTYHTTYDNSYLYAFLLTYRSFTTPHGLLEKLIQRYNLPPPSKETITHKEFGIWQNDVLNKVRLRVSQVIKKWIENHYYDFENDAELVQKVLDFTKMMEETHGSAFATQIQRALKKQQTSDSSKSIVIFDKDDISVPKTLYPRKYNENEPINLLEWPSGELARQITLIEYQMFHCIQPKECLNQSWNKSYREEKAPNIFAMINWFNNVSRWVATCVVQEENPKQRKLTLTKMIHLAEACYKLNNFNAIFEIVSGLQNAAVHRLRKTWEAISTRERKEYERLVDLVSRDNNYRSIRRAILDVKPPCIPYIGVFLTDLTFIEDGNPDILNGKINFIKRRKLAMLIRDIQTYQQTPYKLHHLPQLQEQLRNIKPMQEDQLYSQSLIIEPRVKKQ
jgi:son of sevenless-like protein